MGMLLWGSIMKDMDSPGELVVTSRSSKTLSTTAATSLNRSVVSSRQTITSSLLSKKLSNVVNLCDWSSCFRH